MDSKSLLVNSIKEWIIINNKILSLQKSLKELRNEKKKISNTLISVMENNNIDEFDINNGKLIYRKTKVKAPITKEYLTNMLEKYFEKYPEVDTNDVGNFLLENRHIKETPNLVIKENK